jgi:hypothetical protein
MGKKVEKILNYAHSDRWRHARRWAKKVVVRARRRSEKRSPEDAPTLLRAFIRGWWL